MIKLFNPKIWITPTFVIRILFQEYTITVRDIMSEIFMK